MFNIWLLTVSSPKHPFTWCYTSGRVGKEACTLSLLDLVKSQTLQAHLNLTPNHNQSQVSFLSLLSQAVFQTCLGEPPPAPSSLQKASLCEYNKPFHTLWVCVHVTSVLTSGPNLGWGFIPLLWVNTTPWQQQGGSCYLCWPGWERPALQRMAIPCSTKSHEGVNRPGRL